MGGKPNPSFFFAWSFLLRSGQRGLASEQAEAMFLTFRIFEKAGPKESCSQSGRLISYRGAHLEEVFFQTGKRVGRGPFEQRGVA